MHDPWVLLGAIAAATERVVLGTLVTPLSRRRPTTLAKQVITLDHLSKGRAVLGVGLGEPPERDFADLGDDADPRTRAARMDESLAVLDGLLRGERVDHEGEHYRVHARFRPGPVSRPRPPIWVAGVVPNRRPVARARRWDGVVPLGQGLTGPGLRAYLGDDIPPGWEVVASPGGPYDPAEWQTAGATWVIESTWPAGDWVGELHDRVRNGPPRS